MTQVDAARTPVVVGIGQSIEREKVVTAIDLAERAARAAFADAPGLEARIERVCMAAAIFSSAGKAPASAVATRLGLRGVRQREVSTVGGNTPQWLVTQIAAEIAAGKLRAALVVGAEATRSLLQSNPGVDFMRGARASAADADDTAADPVVGPSAGGMIGPAEVAAGLMRPADVYAVFESALAAAAGRSPQAQREHLGRLLAPFTAVAEANPFAWFPKSLTADEISRPSDKNRLTAEPYSKRMNSFPNVEQGSALIVTSLEVARRAGLSDQAVFVWGRATNSDVTPVARRDRAGSRRRARSHADRRDALFRRSREQLHQPRDRLRGRSLAPLRPTRLRGRQRRVPVQALARYLWQRSAHARLRPRRHVAAAG